MRSDNLSRHIKTHQSSGSRLSNSFKDDEKVERIHQIFNGFVNDKQKPLMETVDSHLKISPDEKKKSTDGKTRKRKSLEESDAESDEESSDEEPDENEELYELIHSTFDYVTKHDQEELNDLIAEFKKEVSEEFADSVLLLEELLEKYVADEFLEGELTLPKIKNVMRRLWTSPITKWKQSKFNMFLYDLEKNRHRVKSILTRLSNVESEEMFEHVLKSLLREELISMEQYEHLKHNFVAELPVIADIIRETKVGQGLKFLPRSTRRLKLMRDHILNEGIDESKNELEAIAAELRQRQEKDMRRGKF